MRDLASDGTTMMVVTHEMSYACEVASRVVFMGDGQIAEEVIPTEVMGAPRYKRIKMFLQRVLDPAQIGTGPTRDRSVEAGTHQLRVGLRPARGIVIDQVDRVGVLLEVGRGPQIVAHPGP